MNKARDGFTIIEVTVVIAVISILTVLAVMSVQNVQSRSADAERSSKITIISELLEKYYNKNGEYPGCTAMSQSAATIATNTLIGINQDSLSTPSDDSGTNSILASCADLTAGNDKFAYVGDGTATCLTGAACTKYTLKYLSEESDAIKSLNSRHGSQIAVPITAIAAISGTTVVGQTLTAGALTPAAATVTYQWQSSTTVGGTYTNISGATSNTFILPFSQIGKFIKITATGTGSYSGTQTSAATAIVTDPSWITIGAQTWAKANVNTGTMVNGTITQTNNGGTNIIEKYCYDNMESNCTTYGALYQWGEAMKYSIVENSQGICPTGSHIPSDNDLKLLEIQLGMNQAQADASNQYRGADQDAQLKAGGASGLNVLLSGYRGSDTLFNTQTLYTGLWSSSESSSNAWYRALGVSQTGIYRSTPAKDFGFSVRCLIN